MKRPVVLDCHCSLVATYVGKTVTIRTICYARYQSIGHVWSPNSHLVFPSCQFCADACWETLVFLR